MVEPVLDKFLEKPNLSVMENITFGEYQVSGVTLLLHTLQLVLIW